MDKKIILIDFEGIQSFGEYIPFMFSIAIKNDDGSYLIRTRQLSCSSMTTEKWANDLGLLLKLEILNRFDLKDWNEFNEKFDIYGWDPSFENRIFKEITKDTNSTLQVKNVLDGMPSVSLSKLTEGTSINRNYFSSLKNIVNNKTNSHYKSIPSAYKSEINKTAMKQDGRIASIYGYIFREISNQNHKWTEIAKIITPKTISHELKEYSSDDIRQTALMYESMNEYKEHAKLISGIKEKIAPLKRNVKMLTKLKNLIESISNSKILSDNILTPKNYLNKFLIHEKLSENKDARILISLFQILWSNQIQNEIWNNLSTPYTTLINSQLNSLQNKILNLTNQMNKHFNAFKKVLKRKKIVFLSK